MTQAKAITTSLNKMAGVVPAKGRNEIKPFSKNKNMIIENDNHILISVSERDLLLSIGAIYFSHKLMAANVYHVGDTMSFEEIDEFVTTKQ